MARARNIKPGFFKNEDLAECSAFARLCFAGLWTLADREGRLEDRPKRIKGDLFPYDTVDVEPLLGELAKWKFIERYVVDGVAVIQILQFQKHQTPHFKEVPSTLPVQESPRLSPHSMDAKPEALPSLNESETQDKPEPRSVPAPPESGFLNPDSLNPSTSPPAKAETLPAGFARFWETWPRSDRKEAKGKCLDVWKRARCEAVSETILAHVAAKKQSNAWTKGGGEFIPAPLVYLNKRSWEGAEEVGTADSYQASIV